MKILVTGGAGYIGSVLVPEFLRIGYEVTVIDNFSYGQTSLLDVCNQSTLTIVRGDVRNQELLVRHIDNSNYIIPLACVVGAPACDRDPVLAQSTNFGAIELLLKLRTKEQRIIYPNTNSGYGIGEKNIYCTEETPLNPISLYGQTKINAERALLKDGNAITLRLATVFGVSPRMRLDLLVNDFVYRAVNDRFVVLFEAHFKRNFIHIRDVVRAFLHAMGHFNRMKNEPYNVGLSDANLSKLELCEEIRKQIPSFTFLEAPVGEDLDKRNYIVSNDKIEKSGFVPHTSLQEGIAELIKAYQIIRRNQFTNI